MADYTTRNRLVKQATNENKNTWGAVQNAGLIELVDFALDGITSLALTGDVTLTTANGATDEARARTLLITSTGGANRIVTIPAVQKWYKVVNRGANLVTIKTASGAGVIVPAGVTAEILCDGTDCTRLKQNAFGLFLTRSYTDFSSSNLDFNLTSYCCDDFDIRIYGASVNNTDAAGLTLNFSADGLSWSASATTIFDFGASASTTGYGEIELRGANNGLHSATAKLASLTSNNTAGLAIVGVPCRVSGGAKHVRITQTTGGTAALDAGTFELWGR